MPNKVYNNNVSHIYCTIYNTHPTPLLPTNLSKSFLQTKACATAAALMNPMRTTQRLARLLSLSVLLFRIYPA